MSPPARPTEAEFLAASPEQVAEVAPEAMVFAPGGTRRAAVLAGVDPNSDEYPRWSFERALSLFDTMFRGGVQHLFTGVITPNQWNEVGPYRSKLTGWVERFLANEESFAAYHRHGWRVRLIGWERGIPELAQVAKKLEEGTPAHAAKTLWWWAIPSQESVWEHLLEAAHRTGAKTREALTQAVYGEALPLVSLYLGFGKPELSPAHLPPLLAGKVDCYWTTRPGYSLDEAELRRIFYDRAFLRSTWRADKTGRADASLPHREAWLRGPTLGLGMRLGEEFWYPAPTPPPAGKGSL